MGLGWGLAFCTPHQLPGEADTALRGPHVCQFGYKRFWSVRQGKVENSPSLCKDEMASPRPSRVLTDMPVLGGGRVSAGVCAGFAPLRGAFPDAVLRSLLTPNQLFTRVSAAMLTTHARSPHPQHQQQQQTGCGPPAHGGRFSTSIRLKLE